jgi:hypothetical protein
MQLVKRDTCGGKNVPPWSYRIFEPNTKTATVRVRLFAAALPSKGGVDESIEALVEVPWQNGRDGQALQRDALQRLQTLLSAEIERLGQ